MSDVSLSLESLRRKKEVWRREMHVRNGKIRDMRETRRREGGDERDEEEIKGDERDEEEQLQGISEDRHIL